MLYNITMLIYHTIVFCCAELIEPMWPDGPQRIEVGECDCSIAWLYKDAHKYGLTQYQDLVGDSGNNIICDSVGAILLAEDPDFISLMDSCPGNKILI